MFAAQLKPDSSVPALSLPPLLLPTSLARTPRYSSRDLTWPLRSLAGCSLLLLCFRSGRAARVPAGRVLAHRRPRRHVLRGGGRVRGVGGCAGRGDRAGAAGDGVGVHGDVRDAGGGGRVQQRGQPRRQGHRVAARVEVQVGASRRRRRGEGENPLPLGPGPDTHVQ